MDFDTNHIKQFLDTDAGAQLKAYLTSRLKDLASIESVKEYSKAQDQAVELKAQKKAYIKLKEILGEIMAIDEVKILSETELKDRAKEYGL